MSGFQDGHSPFGTVLAFALDEAHVDFEVYQVTGEDDDGYLFGPGDGMVHDPERPISDVHGMVKWDGCSHVHFGHKNNRGYLHLCGSHDWYWLGAVLAHVLRTAREMLGEKWDGDTDQTENPK